MGIIHVLTGPDHLSAIATLSGTNIERNTRRSSFMLGVKWGLGHSFGLLLVGGILIFLEESSGDWIGMDTTLSRILESFVGVFMLCLGIYGLFKADRNHKEGVIDDLSNHHPNTTQMQSLKELSDAEKNEMVECMVVGGEPIDIHGSLVRKMEGVLRMDDISERSGRSANNNYRGSSYGGLSDSDYQDDDYYETRTLGEQSMVTILDTRNRRGTMETVDMPHLQIERPNDSSELPQTHKMSKRSSPTPMEMEVEMDKTPTASNKKSNTLMTASSLISKHTVNPIHRRSSGIETEGLYDKYLYPCCGDCGKKFSFSPGMLAIAAGILHGVAGPGGVLGVIPAVELRDAKCKSFTLPDTCFSSLLLTLLLLSLVAIIYLGTFCLTSTFVMAGFATFYGSLSDWMAGGSRCGGRGSSSRVLMVEVGSSLLSVCVGVIWLVLLAVGKLDEVFP